jgi:hypothetical protein
MDGVTEPRFYDENYDRRGWLYSLFKASQRRSKVVNKTSAYTVEADVWAVRVDATGGAVTITLPLSASWRGREIIVIKVDASANAVTVARSGSDVINGSASHSLASQYSKARYVADGTINWDIL